MKRLIPFLMLAAATAFAQGPTIKVETTMPPPAWALMERALLKANSDAARLFYKKYVDDKGYLKHTIRWGTLDGPDDAIETYYNWTLLHALGGDAEVLDMYRKAQEGHLAQYGELRTKLTKLAENGAYYKEFITMSDWFHTGEGMRAFLLAGLSMPNDHTYTARMKRFAGMYMNEDPEAPNYDPAKKIIKSIWNGAKGPMLTKATTYDWVGDPVPGSFHLKHNPAKLTKMLDMAKHYDKMLAHCDEYLDSAGDINLNLAATTLAMNAFMLTGESKYKAWALDYADAWRARTAEAGGMVPSNIGLDGKLGGEYKGQWWKGTYGWNFTIFDGELEQIAHRNYFIHGTWPGFSNALLLSGDQKYVDVLRKQMELLYAAKKTEGGKTLYPQMYGDPRGYKYDGKPQWYHFTDNSFSDRMTEIYLWSGLKQDYERIPQKPEWLEYVEGRNPSYPEKALEKAFRSIRQNLKEIDEDYLLDLQPVNTEALLNLTTGGYFANGRIWVLHSRLRYFDPELRRAGLPQDVAALVERMDSDSVTVQLVNTNQTTARPITIQAGGYGEHSFTGADIGGKSLPLSGRHLTLNLAPGAGTKILFRMKRYTNSPTFHLPWNQ
jgi:hypothetical protein